MAVFRRHGFRRSSIEQAAEAAGLTRQALYHHFESKEALFRAVIERLHETRAGGRDRGGERRGEGRRRPCRHPDRRGDRAAQAVDRVVRRLAAYRGAVLRTSAAGARPLPEICRALRRPRRCYDRAGLPQAAPRAGRWHDAAKAGAMPGDGDQRRQVGASGDAAGRRLRRRPHHHGADAGRRRRYPLAEAIIGQVRHQEDLSRKSPFAKNLEVANEHDDDQRPPRPPARRSRCASRRRHPGRSRSHRHQAGVRGRRVRRLHRAGGRRAGRELPDAGARRRRQIGDDGGRHRRAAAASGAEGLHGARRAAMRVLHAGLCRRGRRVPRSLARRQGNGDPVARGNRRGAVGTSVPLRRL